MRRNKKTIVDIRPKLLRPPRKKPELSLEEEAEMKYQEKEARIAANNELLRNSRDKRWRVRRDKRRERAEIKVSDSFSRTMKRSTTR